MAFNFKKTKPAEETNFFKPGVYRMVVTKVEGGTFEKKGTPFMAVTLQTQDKQELIEKFVISEAALGRIQYLHEAWFGKLCEAEFSDEDEMIEYFDKKFKANKKPKRVIVGGDEIGTAVFAHLPFTKFVDSDEKLELGEFEKGGEEWNKYVKKKEGNSASAGKPNGLLNDTDDDGEIGTKKKKVVKKQVEDDDDADTDEDDTPPPPKKKVVKKEEAKPSKKKAPEPEDEDADEDADSDDDDLPWGED